MKSYDEDASERNLLFKELLLENRKKIKIPRQKMCLCCNDVARPTSHFCSKDCQEDYEFHVRKK